MSSAAPVSDASLLATLLAAAVLEEVVFRLGLHEALLRAAPRYRILRLHWRLLSAPNILTALAFAVIHGYSRGWPVAAAALPAALGIGCLYERFLRLWPCIAAHAALNLLWFAAAMCLPAMGAWSGSAVRFGS